MAFHDDLLTLAGELIEKSESDAAQAELRRAVSTAYYALFHLLISETVLNWNRESSRPALGRMFDHGLMRRASQRAPDGRLFPLDGQDPETLNALIKVAKAFVQLQDKRHLADYHNGVMWTKLEAQDEVVAAREAFANWAAIRGENIAQEYLVSLLIKSRD